MQVSILSDIVQRKGSRMNQATRWISLFMVIAMLFSLGGEFALASENGAMEQPVSAELTEPPVEDQIDGTGEAMTEAPEEELPAKPASEAEPEADAAEPPQESEA